MTEHLISHDLLLIMLFCRLFNQRVCILPLPFIIQIKGLMVDAGAGICNILHIGFDPPCQHFRSPLDAMAQSRHIHLCLALHPSAQHCHRIGIVQKYGPGTIGFNILTDSKHLRQGPHRPEDSGRSPSIPHINVYTVFLWNRNIICPDSKVSYINGADNAVSILKSLNPAFRRNHFCRIISGTNNFLYRLCSIHQFFIINIHQGNRGILECRKRHQIPHQASGKYNAACAYKCNFFHLIYSLYRVSL